MVIDFTFEVPAIGSPWRDTWDRAESAGPATIGESDLCYKYFGVRARFVIDDVEVISDKGSVTLVDLALSVQYALKRITSGEDATIGFTESREVIRLKLKNDNVIVQSSNLERLAVVNSDAIVDAFEGFLKEAYSSLVEHLPGLAENPVIQGLRQR